MVPLWTVVWTVVWTTVVWTTVVWTTVVSTTVVWTLLGVQAKPKAGPAPPGTDPKPPSNRAKNPCTKFPSLPLRSPEPGPTKTGPTPNRTYTQIFDVLALFVYVSISLSVKGQSYPAAWRPAAERKTSSLTN